MPVTNIRGKQILDGTVARVDLDVSTAGSAVVRRLIAGTNITFTSTGVDTGTGDVTIAAVSGGGLSLTRVVTVTPTGQGGQYNTITAAINFITTTRTLPTDYYLIQFTGSFTETVSLPGNIGLLGLSIDNSNIVGSLSINATNITDLNEIQNFKIIHDSSTNYPLILGGAGSIIGSDVYATMSSGRDCVVYIDRTDKTSPIRINNVTGVYDNTSSGFTVNFIGTANNANFPTDFRMDKARFIAITSTNSTVGFIDGGNPTNTDGRAFFTNPVYDIRTVTTSQPTWTKLFISQKIDINYINQEVFARTFNSYPQLSYLGTANDKTRVFNAIPIIPNSRWAINNSIPEGSVFYAEKTSGDYGLYLRKPSNVDFRIDTVSSGSVNTASGILNFGTDLQTDITTTVNAAWITANSIITAVLRNSAISTDHTVEDGTIEGLQLNVISQIAGSCVVQANSPNGSIGIYNFALIGI